jgi:hypothetical protein
MKIIRRSSIARPLGLAILAALLLAAPAVSQDAPESRHTGEKMFTFTPAPNGNDVEQLLEILEKSTPVTLIYDPSSPQIRGRKCTVKGEVTIPESEIFGWVRSLLFFQRLVLVPTGPRRANAWMVVDFNNPSLATHPEYVPEAELLDWERRDGAYIVTTITMKNLSDTARARNALAQLTTRQVGRINDIPQTRSFVIADFAPVAVACWRMLKTMDDEAGKLTPEEREALDPRTRQKPPVKTTDQQLLDKYEQRLMGSQTSQAAQYFLSKILELETRIEKAKVEAGEE